MTVTGPSGERRTVAGASPGPGSALERQLRAFIARAQGADGGPPASAADGAAAVRVADAALLSARVVS
jgi:hypothetical protein